MFEDVTLAMTDAALEAWIGTDFPKWKSFGEVWTKALRDRMRRALAAGMAAAPSGHGERG